MKQETRIRCRSETSAKKPRFESPPICWDIIKQGRLCIQRPNVVTEISSVWPRPAARRSSRKRPAWHDCEPAINLATSRTPYREFFTTIPAPVRTQISGFLSHQWTLLAAVAREPAMYEMLKENPALGFLMLVHAEDDSNGLVAPPWRELLHQRQRDIAGALGFPGTSAAVRILGKVARQSVRPREMRSLRAALADPQVMKWLLHAPAIDAAMIWLVSEPVFRARLSGGLIGEMAARGSAAVSGAILLKLYRVMTARGQQCGVFRTMEQVERAWRALVIPVRPGNPEPTHVPSSPIPATENIVLLTTSAEIKREAREQHNCVDGYIKRAMAGEVFLFRVLRPERATLSLVKRRGSWVRGELKARENRQVKPETARYVDQWLATST